MSVTAHHSFGGEVEASNDGERAVLKLMFGALIRAAEQWRSVKVTEFERRQMTAVRKELDQEYEATVGLNAKPSKDEADVKLSRNYRT
jgi:hypothetical protein